MATRPFLSPTKTLTITSASFSYNPLDPVVSIPLSDTTAYGRTLVAGDFPVYTYTPIAVRYIEKCCVSGRNNSGGNVTIYFKMYKTTSGGSRTEVASGNASIATSKYFHADCNFYDVSVGDKCEVSVWGSSNTNVTVNCSLSHVVPTRILPTRKKVIDASITYNLESYPGTNPTILSTSSRHYTGSAFENMVVTDTTYNIPATAFESYSEYNMFRYGKGDYQSPDVGAVSNSSTSIPYISVSQIPTEIKYRELLL